jgi:hypothetical protein
MKLPGIRPLSLLLIGTLLLCHGAFGALHLICASPECAGDAEHPAEHHAAAVAGDAHEHPVGHATSTDYFAVVAGLLVLLVGLLRTGTWTEERPGSRRAISSLREHRVFRPARAPTSRVLQVFRL